jgi:hypothetical protein
VKLYRPCEHLEQGQAERDRDLDRLQSWVLCVSERISWNTLAARGLHRQSLLIVPDTRTGRPGGRGQKPTWNLASEAPLLWAFPERSVGGWKGSSSAMWDLGYYAATEDPVFASVSA